MKVLLGIILFLVFTILNHSCEKDSTSIGQSSHQNFLPIAEAVNRISIELVDYDSISIGAESDFVINSQDIDKILIGRKTNGSFIKQDSILPSFVKVVDGYKVEFNVGQKLDESFKIYNLSIRYILSDMTFFDIDTLMKMYKYPYDLTEIFITYEEIFPDGGVSGPGHVQDFELNLTNMFIWPLGGFGLYEYDFTSGHLQELVSQGAGDFIAHDSNYVFFTFSSASSYARYDLERNTTEWFPIGNEGNQNRFVGGLYIYDGVLYVMLYSTNPPSSLINKYNLNGGFIESIPYGRLTFYIAIHNNIVYSIYLSDSKRPLISRFDLNTKVFLEDRIHPASDWEGIDVVGDKFYYTDHKKLFIGSIPLSQLD